MTLKSKMMNGCELFIATFSIFLFERLLCILWATVHVDVSINIRVVSKDAMRVRTDGGGGRAHTLAAVVTVAVVGVGGSTMRCTVVGRHCVAIPVQPRVSRSSLTQYVVDCSRPTGVPSEKE